MFYGNQKTRKTLFSIMICLLCLLFMGVVFQAHAAITIKKPSLKEETQKIIKKKPNLKIRPKDTIKPPLEIKKIPEISREINIKPETFGTLKATPRGIWEPENGREGSFFILLSEEVSNLNNVLPYVQTYAEDVASDGYQVKLYTITFDGDMDPFFSNVKNLKSFIRSKWLRTLKECEEGRLSKQAFEMGTGIVLIGPFPLPLVHKRMRTYKEEPPGSGTVEKIVYEGVFACDLYLTDMDGNWNLVDETGYPLITTMDYPEIPMDHECVPGDEVHPYWTGDIQDWGKMGAKPEIWMGRINPGNTSFNATTDGIAITDYLFANHKYRKGIEQTSEQDIKEQTFKNRLIYYDDDMRHLAQETADMMAITWPGPVFGETSYAGTGHPKGYTRIVNGTNTTNKADYIERLKLGNYLWVETFMHSAHDLHQFDTSSGIEKVHKQELFKEQKMKALFYYHHGCSACDYKQKDNLGENYLFYPNHIGDLKPMAVLGNTTVGPHETGPLYVSLAYGMNIGQAQMLTQRSYARNKNWVTVAPSDPGHVNPKRYYSQTLLGDPTLRPIQFSPSLVPPQLNLPSVYKTVTQKIQGASYPSLGKLKNTANIASSAEPVMKKGLKPGKAYPVVSGGIVQDPLWQKMNIPGLKKIMDSLRIKDMAEFDIKKIEMK